MLVPGPVQAAAVVALADDAHVDEQRERYRERLEFSPHDRRRAACPPAASTCGRRRPAATRGRFTEDWRRDGGALVSPGDLYGAAGAGYVRVALVQPMERLRARRRAASG